MTKYCELSHPSVPKSNCLFFFCLYWRFQVFVCKLVGVLSQQCTEHSNEYHLLGLRDMSQGTLLHWQCWCNVIWRVPTLGENCPAVRCMDLAWSLCQSPLLTHQPIHTSVSLPLQKKAVLLTLSFCALGTRCRYALKVTLCCFPKPDEWPRRIFPVHPCPRSLWAVAYSIPQLREPHSQGLKLVPK